jgi:hypothetical protein
MRVLSALATLALLVPVAGCDEQAEPQPAGVAALSTPSVTVGSVNGSGCPAGTVSASPAADGSSVRVVYSAFTAKAGAGAGPTELRRNCQTNLRIVSPGQTYAVASVRELGAVSVPAGGSALQRTSYYLAGGATGTPVDHAASGPLSGVWDQTDTNPFAAPCGTTRNLNVNVELRVASPGPAASLSLNGASNGTTVNLSWSSCP